MAPGVGDAGRAMLQVLRENTGPLLLWFVALQLITIVAYWISSMAMAGNENTGTIGNAVKVYFLYLLLTFGAIIGAALAFPALMFAIRAMSGQGDSGSLGIGAGLLGVGFLLLFVSLIFLIPMRVYRIGFGRALGFLALTILIAAVGQWGLGIALGNTANRVVERLVQITQANSGAPSGGLLGELAERTAHDAEFGDQEKVAADPAHTFQERQAALSGLYEHLQQMRGLLSPGDVGARGAYEQRKARYEVLLRQVKAEYAAQRGGR